MGLRELISRHSFARCAVDAVACEEIAGMVPAHAGVNGCGTCESVFGSFDKGIGPVSH